MASNPQLLIKVIADTASAKKDMDSLTSSFQDFGQKAAAAFAVAAAAIAAGLADAIGSASDLHEAINATRHLFGDSADNIIKWADTADTAFGTSKKSALDAVATFGLFGEEAGLTGQELVKFSTTLVELGADLASFKNTSPEQALNALGSALAGQIRPLRNYAVLLSAAAVEEEALALGLGSVEGAMGARNKILATYSLIMKQTKPQQKDFIRTSQDLAQQQKIFAAQIENTSAALGTIFLPIAKSVFSYLNTTLIPVLANAVEGFRVFFIALTGGDVDPESAAKWAGPMLDAAKKVHDFFKTKLEPVFKRVIGFLADNKEVFIAVAAGFTAIGIAIAAVAASSFLLNTAFTFLASHPVILALVVIATALGLAWKNSEAFREAATNAFNAAKTAIQPLIDKVVVLWALFQEKLPEIIDTLAGWKDNVLEKLQPVIDLFGTLRTKIGEAIGDVLTVLAPFANKVGAKFQELKTKVEENLPGMFETLSQWKDNVVNKLGELWDGFKEKLPGIHKTLVEWKADVLAALPEILVKVGGWKDDFLQRFEDLKKGLQPKIDAIMVELNRFNDAFQQADKPEIAGGWFENLETWWNETGKPFLDSIVAEVLKFKDEFLKHFTDLLDELAPKWAPIGEELGKLKTAIADLWTEIQPIWDQIKPFLPWLLIALGLLIAPMWTIIGLFVLLWVKCETFRNIVNGAINFIVGTLIPKLIEGFRILLEQITEKLRLIKEKWDVLVGAVDFAVGLIKWIIGFMWDPIYKGLTWAIALVKFQWDNLVGEVERWKRVIGLLLEKVWDPLWGSLQTIWRKIVDFWNNAKIPNIPDIFVPKAGPNMTVALAPAPSVMATGTSASTAAPRAINVTVNHTGLAIDSPRLQRDIVGAIARYERREGHVRSG